MNRGKRPHWRAVLEGVQGLDRPLQVFGADVAKLKEWSDDILKQYPQGHVDFYETKEIFQWSRRAPKEDKGEEPLTTGEHK